MTALFWPKQAGANADPTSGTSRLVQGLVLGRGAGVPVPGGGWRFGVHFGRRRRVQGGSGFFRCVTEEQTHIQTHTYFIET